MKSKWTFKNLGDVCHVIGGGTPSKDRPDFYGGDIPWATIRDMRQDLITVTEHRITQDALKNSASNVIPEGNVVIATRVGLGKVSMVAQGTAINQDLRGIVPMDRRSMDPRFLFWWAKNVSPLIVKAGTGATVQGVKVPFVKSLKIPIIPISVQRHIVSILDEAFDGIATAKANAEKNLQNALALFESHLWSIFDDAGQSANLVSLAELATDITDGDHMPPPKSATGVPFITIGNIVKDTRVIDFSDTFNVSQEYFSSLKPNKKPQKGDVLYTVTGSFGIPVIVSDDAKFCFQRHIGLIRPKLDTSSKWLYYLLLSPQVFKQATDGATGTAQKTVSLKVLRGFQVPKLKPELQRAAVVKLDAIAAETQRLESIYQRKLVALDELKQSLLHQAFSGAL